MDNPSATTSSGKNRKRGTTAATAAAVAGGSGVGSAGGKKRSKTTATAPPLFVPVVCGGNNDDEEEDKKRLAEGIVSADVGGVGILARATESMEEGGEAEAQVGIGPTSPGIGIDIGLADVGLVKLDPWVKEELAVRMQEPYIDDNPAALVGGLIAQPEENWPIKPEMVE